MTKHNPYYAAFMLSEFSHKQLPQCVNPRRLAQAGVEIKASLPVSVLGRLHDLLYDDSGEAIVELAFSTSCQNNCQLTGNVKANLRLVCQRCLSPFNLSAECGLKCLMVDTEEQVENVPAPWEPWLVSEKTNLYRLIEDELLLALPLIPCHKQNCMPADLLFCTGDSDIAETQVGADAREEIQVNNVFEILKDLKNHCKLHTD